MHVPLRRLAMCLDCEECFEIALTTCPACGGRGLTTLARFLERTSANFLSRVVGDTPRRPRQLVIVARHQRALYEHLARLFEGNETIHVILDRRDTAGKARYPILERRRDRTRQVERQLRTLGCTVVVLDEDHGRSAEHRSEHRPRMLPAMTRSH